MSIVTRSFAEVFREAREAKGWTQEQAARELGVSHRTIQGWESGEKQPRLAKVPLICEKLDLHLELPFGVDSRKSSTARYVSQAVWGPAPSPFDLALARAAP